jgi:flagellar basal body-associated protein FliL
VAEKNNKNTQRQNSPAAVIVIILIMAGIVVAAVFLPRLFNAGVSGGRSVNVRLPLIQTTLTSSADGEEHNVQTLFTVEMDNETRQNVDNALLEETIADIMTGMDFDSVRGPDGVDYLNEQVTRELNERLADYTESEVYLTDIFIGDVTRLADPPPQSNDIIRGLFDKVE